MHPFHRLKDTTSPPRPRELCFFVPCHDAVAFLCVCAFILRFQILYLQSAGAMRKICMHSKLLLDLSPACNKVTAQTVDKFAFLHHRRQSCLQGGELVSSGFCFVPCHDAVVFLCLCAFILRFQILYLQAREQCATLACTTHCCLICLQLATKLLRRQLTSLCFFITDVNHACRVASS